MIFSIKVKPKSPHPKITEKTPTRFEIHVKAKAERGEATKEALSILAKHLNVPIKKIRLIRGARQPNKIVEIIAD